MKKKGFKYIYGPVSSWRLGASLGIDVLSRPEKICTFDCLYCQIGRTKTYSTERKIYVPTEKIIKELKNLPAVRIDYLTFSGRGEPTLAQNLGELVRAIRKIRSEPIAILTNSTLINQPAVQKNLLALDTVCFKLDACCQEMLEKINKPAPGINFRDIIKGIKEFKKQFRGRLVLQVMLIESNKNFAEKIAGLAREINPDEIHLNTPLRPSPVKPLTPEDMLCLVAYFKGLKTVSVYDIEKRRIEPISKKDTLKRRGKSG